MAVNEEVAAVVYTNYTTRAKDVRGCYWICKQQISNQAQVQEASKNIR